MKISKIFTRFIWGQDATAQTLAQLLSLAQNQGQGEKEQKPDPHKDISEATTHLDSILNQMKSSNWEGFDEATKKSYWDAHDYWSKKLFDAHSLVQKDNPYKQNDQTQSPNQNQQQDIETPSEKYLRESGH